MKIFRIFAFLLVFFVWQNSPAQAETQTNGQFSNSNFKNYNSKLEIIDAQKNVIAKFKVQIANSERAREYGLMNLDYLPQNLGMIFEFDKEQEINMWMKNTKIPLDMIFIDKNNYIVDIFEGAKPYSLEIISAKKPAKKVLEINGSLVKKLGIKIGSKIIIN